MEREKAALKEIAQAHEFEIISWAVAVRTWIFRSTGKRRSGWKPSKSR